MVAAVHDIAASRTRPHQTYADVLRELMRDGVHASMHNATVLGHRNGRVQVAVHFTDVDEPITTSYRPDELSAA